MLQMGTDSLGPSMTNFDGYRGGSALLNADKVEIPLMLIHADLDFIPIPVSRARLHNNLCVFFGRDTEQQRYSNHSEEDHVVVTAWNSVHGSFD